jgi:hypothetical protein
MADSNNKQVEDVINDIGRWFYFCVGGQIRAVGHEWKVRQLFTTYYAYAVDQVLVDEFAMEDLWTTAK